MTIAVQQSDDRKELRLKIIGRLELADHRDFREAYIASDPSQVSYVVDLQDTASIDSATLGMLLAMREDLGGEKVVITLANCSPEIVKILSVTNISRLFVIQ